MSDKIKVTGIDNRGNAEYPFGYVYFSGNWGTGSEDHFRLADSALVKHFK